MSEYWSVGLVVLGVLVFWMIREILTAPHASEVWVNEDDQMFASVSNLDMDCPVSVDAPYDWSRDGL